MILADRLLHVFHWPATHQIRLVLPAMLITSIMLHAAGFYLLQARTPAGGPALPPLPAKLKLWAETGSGSLLIAARDPAWIEPGRQRDRLLPMPSLAKPWRALQPEPPTLVPAPSPTAPPVWVPALPPLAVQPRLEPRAVPTAPALEGLIVRFDGDGPEITADLLGRLRTAAPAQPPGAATELLVVLDAAGEARHVWLLRSSGDAALDAAAQRAVQRSRFGPSESLYRGVLRIIWAPAGTTP
jgi:TonB family protein